MKAGAKSASRKKLYELTPEHRAQLTPWADRWIANALSTAPMDDADRDAMRVAVNGLYDAANLPRPARIVFCASPIGGAIAASVASGVWWLRENPSQHRKLFGRPLTEADLSIACRRAVAFAVARGIHMTRTMKPLPAAPVRSAATWAATGAATRAATGAATRAATRAATGAATGAATEAATWAATRDATEAATRDATEAATGAADPVAMFLVGCSQWWGRFYAGGNFWSGYSAYLSFFRHIAGLSLPEYERWQHFEAASVHAGPRFMHAKFCIVSDRPTVIAKDDRNRPHREDGPFIAWRDGWELYAWHGARVPAEWILHRASLDPKTALTHPNIEQRRAAAEIVGWARILERVKATVVDTDDPEIGTLYRADLPDAPGSQFLEVRCGTGRKFVLPVPGDLKTALAANSWTYDVPQVDLKKLEVRT